VVVAELDQLERDDRNNRWVPTLGIRPSSVRRWARVARAWRPQRCGIEIPEDRRKMFPHA
jgi:hypothetical protein